MITFDALIAYGRKNNCSDIHLTPGFAPVFRKAGQLFDGEFVLTAEETIATIRSLMIPSQLDLISKGQDVDFCYQTPDGYRQRVNVYQQQGELCCALRILNETIPTIEQLHLPPILKQLANLPHGLILVTGPTGSGKSTTLASMIDYINQSQKKHIITIEDPIEYVYTNKNAMIHQREVGPDVASFSSALRSAMREDPDVILVGEMRDYETISAAVTAAETGHLVLSTLHTTGA
ncbi:MAG: ATPase, T2SS/T4P/T4SS family, partial [Oscillospiraceae bacterium]